MNILTKELQKISSPTEAANVSPEEIEKYYKEHADAYEQFNLDRMFVPRTKQPAKPRPKWIDDKERQESERGCQEGQRRPRTRHEGRIKPNRR
jgi:hypothetical protein